MDLRTDEDTTAEPAQIEKEHWIILSPDTWESLQDYKDELEENAL